MTYAPRTDNSTVASITSPKESTSSGPSIAAESKVQHNRIFSQKRLRASTLRKEYPIIKTSLPTNYPSNNHGSPFLFNNHNLNVYVVGKVGHPKAQIVRVVHISDTRGVDGYYANGLPNGHILIHSGDFLYGPPLRNRKPLRRSCFQKFRAGCKVPQPAFTETYAWRTKIQAINEFFQRQPHPYKIFVSGCWDYLGLDRPSAAQIQQYLPSAIYLEDSACEILGLKVYGIPWTSADDLRPEDGKSHLTSSTGTSKMRAMLPRWLRSSSSSWCQDHQQSKRQRRLSPRPETSVTLTTSTKIKVKEHEKSNAWQVYHSAGIRNGIRSSSLNVKAGSYEAGSSPTSSSCSSTSSSFSTSVPAPALCDGFILSDIRAVEERYAQVPSDTNIIISHMPAWRPELYTHVVDRIRPYLHLCGHDFISYGVTWRRGVVFSNAAVQLTPTYPRVLPHHSFPLRRKAYSTSGGEGGEGGNYPANLFTGTSAPSMAAEREISMGVADGVTTLPSSIPRFTNFGFRPRRWRRRLSSLMYRLSLLSTHSLTEGPLSHPMASDSYNWGGRRSNRIQLTPSSLAALRSSDKDFMVDQTLSVCGNYSGSRGDSRGGYVGRRNPIVFDVYVVLEEGVNDREVLPDYSKSATSHSKISTSCCQSSQTLPRPSTCCFQ